ncbi:T9SS C-terminal target domain-containing protein, partial [bacterium]
QNYPNPFNPVTKIFYEIPDRGYISIKIFDLLGREIRTLFNGVKNPGKYTIDFNGAELSSGVYFCVMKSDDFSQTRRMILIK